MSSASVDYPPAPWTLRGQMHGHVYLVPRDALPDVPAGFRPLVIAGRGLVVAGWVDYQSGSVLSYGELYAAVAGFGAGRRLTATVTHMWVDSAASMRGGRELWGYPKQLARFTLDIDPSGTGTAADDRSELAHGRYRALLTLPRRLRARTGTVQPLAGRLVAVRATISGAPSVGVGGLEIGAGSPLQFLNRGRRLLSVGMRDFEARFGE